VHRASSDRSFVSFAVRHKHPGAVGGGGISIGEPLQPAGNVDYFPPIGSGAEVPAKGNTLVLSKDLDLIRCVELSNWGGLSDQT